MPAVLLRASTNCVAHFGAYVHSRDKGYCNFLAGAGPDDSLDHHQRDRPTPLEEAQGDLSSEKLTSIAV
jgi:hypothetical protein